MDQLAILRKNGTASKDVDEFQKQFQLESMRFQGSSEKVYDRMLTTHGIISRLNVLAKKFPRAVQAEFNKIQLQFNNMQDLTLCEICGNKLVAKITSITCEYCGFSKMVDQVYCAAGSQKKQHKSRETMDHYCEIWLEHLQGRGIFTVPPSIYDRLLDMATVKCRGMPQYVNDIKCIDIRRWLNQLEAAKYNKFIPSIHRRITKDLGNEIIPPQFTEEEKQVIISDWKFLSATYCQEYKKLKPRSNKKRNNMPYYPVCIFFIISKRFTDDIRVKQFETYVYKQSSDTYRLRLQCWEETCKILNYTGSGHY